MSRGSRRTTLTALVALALASVLPGCALFRELGIGGAIPEWREAEYEGVNASDIYSFVLREMQKQFGVAKHDEYERRIESKWMDGFNRSRQKSERYRVVVELDVRERDEDEGGDLVAVRVRVRKQSDNEIGRRFTNRGADWVDDADEPLRAEVFLKQIEYILSDFAKPVGSEDDED